MQAMIFAAGLGTRLKPLTDNKPKALVELGEKPLIEHVIDHFYSEGARRIVVNVHHFANQVVDYINANGEKKWPKVSFAISDESNKLLDTGGGLVKALPLFDPNEPIVVGNADVICNAPLAELLTLHKRIHNDATLLTRVRNTNRQLLFDDMHYLSGWINTTDGKLKGGVKMADVPMYHQQAFCGIHIIEPSLVETMQEEMGTDVFGIIDGYLRLCQAKDIMNIELRKEYHWFDVGTTEKLQTAYNFFYRK